MTYDEELAKVLGILIETVEDLEPDERRSLLRVAHRIDADLNKIVVPSKRFDGYYGDPGPDSRWGTSDFYAVQLCPPSRLAIDAGCTKRDCKVCKKSRSLIAYAAAGRDIHRNAKLDGTGPKAAGKRQ